MCISESDCALSMKYCVDKLTTQIDSYKIYVSPMIAVIVIEEELLFDVSHIETELPESKPPEGDEDPFAKQGFFFGGHSNSESLFEDEPESDF